jgi:hypothetical protein
VNFVKPTQQVVALGLKLLNLKCGESLCRYAVVAGAIWGIIKGAHGFSSE